MKEKFRIREIEDIRQELRGESKKMNENIQLLPKLCRKVNDAQEIQQSGHPVQPDCCDIQLKQKISQALYSEVATFS